MKRKTKKFKIKPENTIKPEELAEFDVKENAPIVEIEEGRVMPLYIFIGMVASPIMKNTIVNVMATALHFKKNDTITVRGRLRFESTGKKTVFEMKEKWPLADIHQAKWKIKEFYESMVRKMFLTEIEPSFEIDFKIGESMEEVIEKMNQSDKFNIGNIKKPK